MPLQKRSADTVLLRSAGAVRSSDGDAKFNVDGGAAQRATRVALDESRSMPRVMEVIGGEHG